MATESISLSQQELEALGSKLESANLTEKDRQVLVAAFAAAGKAVSDVAESDVSGYAFQAPATAGPASLTAIGGTPLNQGLSSGFQGSLSQGLRGDFANKAIIISIGF